MKIWQIGNHHLSVYLVPGRWKRQTWSDADNDTDTDTDKDSFKIHLYIYTKFFSFLMLFLL